jgi:uncharacterized LabA/DUF88 family protein
VDLLYTGRFDAFCIVSSDSDFTRLASRIREHGVTVYGFGERKTPRPFVTACDKFVYVEVLQAGGGMPPTAPAGPKPKPASAADPRLHDLLRQAVEAVSDEEGWAHLGAVGQMLVKQTPDFDQRNYGFAKLSALAEACGILDVERRGPQNTPMVRLKPLRQRARR